MEMEAVAEKTIIGSYHCCYVSLLACSCAGTLNPEKKGHRSTTVTHADTKRTPVDNQHDVIHVYIVLNTSVPQFNSCDIVTYVIK